MNARCSNKLYHFTYAAIKIHERTNAGNML
jgi:hypothetical protein